MTGSDDKFVKLWRIEAWEENVKLTEVTEIDTIREHCDYINSIVIRNNFLYSSSGDINVIVLEYPNPHASIDIELPVKIPREATPPTTTMTRKESSPRPWSPEKEIQEFILTQPDEPLEDDVFEDEPVPDNIENMNESVEENSNEASYKSSSSDTSTSRSKARRRWIIYKEEIELKEEIGKGRYGIVYKGIYKKKTVAVKISNKISKDDYNSTEEGIIKEVGSFCRCKKSFYIFLV